jgi:hypothetical protein
MLSLSLVQKNLLLQGKFYANLNLFLLQLCRFLYCTKANHFFFARASASNNGQGKFQKQKLNGSVKRKKRKNAKNGGNEVDRAKKQDSSEADLSKKTDKEPPVDYPREEEKKVTPSAPAA